MNGFTVTLFTAAVCYLSREASVRYTSGVEIGTCQFDKLHTEFCACNVGSGLLVDTYSDDRV